MQDRMAGPLILGATGKVGSALSRLRLPCFGGAIWQYRPGSVPPNTAGSSLAWDILRDPLPSIRPSAVIVLAGVTSGTPDDLAQNTALALAACDFADKAGGLRVFLTSSQAVYGPRSGRLSEETPCDPNTVYGQAKLEMERAVAGRSNVTCLRLGNVVGCDAISAAMARGAVVLDRFVDGQSPRRAMIGPQTLGEMMCALLAVPAPLPPVLNVAAVGLVAMADLVAAAGQSWQWQEAPPHALPALDLDLSRLQSVVHVPAADPLDLVAQARLAGWDAAL